MDLVLDVVKGAFLNLFNMSIKEYLIQPDLQVVFQNVRDFFNFHRVNDSLVVPHGVRGIQVWVTLILPELLLLLLETLLQLVEDIMSKGQ